MVGAHMSDFILRRVQPDTFKTVSLHHVENDPRLSWKAVGLLTYMLTRPPNWEFYKGDLVNRHTDGRDGVKSGLKELRAAGYLRTRPNPTGGWTWWVSDVPIEDWSEVLDPKAENPPTENPEDGKSAPITKRTIQQGELGSLRRNGGSDTRSEDFEKLWTLCKRGSKKKAREQYMRKVPKVVSHIVLADAWQRLVARARAVEFVPHLFRWIRDERWTEELPSATEQEPEVGTAAWLAREEARIHGN